MFNNQISCFNSETLKIVRGTTIDFDFMSNRRLTRFQVVVDDGGFDFIEVAQRADNLHDNGACLFL